MDSESTIPTGSLQAWQVSHVRKMIRRYRESIYENLNKEKVRMTKDGRPVFTVLSPPLGSIVARRRIRFAKEDLTSPETIIENDEVVKWGKRSPHVFSVAVTYKCQCNCQHCSADTYREKVRREGGLLTFEELRDAINQGVDLGATIVILTGGEPLLRPEIFDLVEAIDKNKCTPIMFTNGEFLTDDVVKKLADRGLYGVFVSIDSAIAGEHDAFRGREGLFEKAVEGIKKTIAAGILTGIATVATKERVHNGDLDGIMELGKELGIMEVVIFDITPAGKLINVVDKLLGKEEIEKIEAFTHRYNELKEYPSVFHESLFSYFAVPCVKGCPGGAVMLHLRANGDVTPCDGIPIPFGNIRNEPLEQIWNRITHDEEYAKPHNGCRMADLDFRRKYLNLS